MAHVQKSDSVFPRNRRVHLNRRGRQFSRLLAAEACGSAGSDCITFIKHVDHSLKMSLQGGKKRIKRSGGCEIVYSSGREIVYSSDSWKLNLRWVSQSLLQKCRRESLKEHVSRRTLCRVLKEGKHVETGVTTAFSTPRKLRHKSALKVS
jgi:hypothetical protein